MNHAAKVLAIAALCWCASSAWGRDDDVLELHGRVVDQAGAPVAGFQVEWMVALRDVDPDPAAPPKANAYDIITTDADGRFNYLIGFQEPAVVLVAHDAATNRGGYAIVERKDAAKPVEITIGKAARLRGRINCADDPKRIVDQTYAVLDLEKRGLRYGSVQSKHARFDILVPPGDYSLVLKTMGGDFIDHRRKITIKPGQDLVDLGAIGLNYQSHVKLRGKPAPPLHVVDARGAPQTVQVSDYKGRWVLLYFWGCW